MCKYFDLFINESMQFALKNNFDEAINIFISHISKTQCTNYIFKNPLTVIILKQHMQDPFKFRDDLRGLDLYLTCMCD